VTSERAPLAGSLARFGVCSAEPANVGQRSNLKSTDSSGMLFPSPLRDDCHNVFRFHIMSVADAGLGIAASQTLDSVARRCLLRESISRRRLFNRTVFTVE
jgi:hypothetical protein